jgi:hypothetical protein
MKKEKQEKLNQNGNGKEQPKTDAALLDNKNSKSYKSAMKAFAMTHKRLFPELYKEKAKRG